MNKLSLQYGKLKLNVVLTDTLIYAVILLMLH
jgi:hypothetical protein